MRNNNVASSGISLDNMVLNDVNRIAFITEIRKHLGNNLNGYIMESLANMLAIDYVGRLKKNPPLEPYVQSCIRKLKDHLQRKVILEEEFSVTMSLFIIAIGSSKSADDELLLSEGKNQDILIDGLITAYFGDLSPAEQKNIREALRGILNGASIKEIINFIHSDQKLFYSVVFSAYKKKLQQKEINELINLNLSRIIAENRSISKKTGIIKSLVCKAALGVSLFAAASLGYLLSPLAEGALLPLILAPVAGICINVAPRIGAKLGGSIAMTSNFVQKKQERLKEFVATIVVPGLQHHLEQSKYLGQKNVPVLEQGLEIKLQATLPVKGEEMAKNLTKNNVRKR